MTLSFSFYLLSKDLNVQLCDATEVDQGTTVGNTIRLSLIKELEQKGNYHLSSPFGGQGALPVTRSFRAAWRTASWLIASTCSATSTSFSLRFCFQSRSFLLIFICK